MRPEDRAAIIAAVRSFRIGAPILISDIRFACYIDGHPIEHVSSKSIFWVLHELCEKKEGKYGPKDRTSWIRRI